MAWRARLGPILALAFVYVVAGKLGLELAFVNASATSVWPPTGIALAALLLYGRRLWPGIWLGAFIVNLATSGSLAASVGIAAGNTLEALVGAVLVERVAGGRHVLDSARSILTFVGLAGASTAVSATGGVISLALSGLASRDAWGPIWVTWWLGDFVSAVMVTPMILAWASVPRGVRVRGHIAEAGSLSVVVLLVGFLIFGGWVSSPPVIFPIEYFGVPPLIWAAFRFHQRGAMTAAWGLSGIAIAGTLNGSGPFAVPDANTALLLLQSFMGVVTLTGLLLGAVVAEQTRTAEALRDREALYHATFEQAAVGIAHVALDGRWLDVNQRLCEIVGYPRSELVARRFQDITHPDDVPGDDEDAIGRIVAGHLPIYRREKRYLRRDGEIVWVNLTVSVRRDSRGVPLHFISVIEDMTARRHAEATRQGEYLFRRAIETAIPAGIAVVDLQGRHTYVNPALCAMVGWEEADLVGCLPPFPYWPPEDRDMIQRTLEGFMSGDATPAVAEFRFCRRHGERFHVAVAMTALRDPQGEQSGWLISVTDITERAQAAAQLTASLHEKEALLKELHHRVKNNLQVISSLLNTESRHIKDEAALRLLTESQMRIKAIAHVHEKLYRSHDLAHIDLATYTREMATALVRTFSSDPQKVTLLIESESLEIGVDAAIPYGLVLNELMSNALKHAFPGGRKGMLRVTLAAEGHDLVLRVSDDGVGLPPGLTVGHTDSMGFQLIADLTAQLNGSVEVERATGTTVTVRFPGFQIGSSSHETPNPGLAA